MRKDKCGALFFRPAWGCGLSEAALPYPPQANEIFSLKMKPPGPEAPVVLVKWYDYAKWLLERVENFPKSQRFVLGQRLTGQAMDVLDLLVEASYAREKTNPLFPALRPGPTAVSGASPSNQFSNN